MKRLWILYLVPDVRFGRWWSAVVLFAVVGGMLWTTGVTAPDGVEGYSWPIALFFCVIVAYITSVFHFITRRTEEALDELAPTLSLEAEKFARLRNRISHKSMAWVLVNASMGTGFWLLQSLLLLGSGEAMMHSLTGSLREFVTAIAPLLVWLTMMCAVHALVDNARLFRRLARQVDVDLLDVSALTPFGRMAVSSTLVVFGSQASFSIMWLDGTTSLWTTIPPLIPTTGALLYLFFAPVWPVHRALESAKRDELVRVQELINKQPRSNGGDYRDLGPLLSYRREVMSIHEWPFDLGLMARLGLYLVIVPATWIGAALIENVVDVFVS